MTARILSIAPAAPVSWARTVTHRLRTIVPAWPLLGLAALHVYQPTDDGVTICPFALVTGTACPGCGLTRALAWMVRGDLVRSWEYHPLAVLIAAEIAVGWWIWMLRRQGKPLPVSRRWIDLALLATAGLLLGVWVLRWATGTLPPV